LHQGQLGAKVVVDDDLLTLNMADEQAPRLATPNISMD
jgi:hypothetical protein